MIGVKYYIINLSDHCSCCSSADCSIDLCCIKTSSNSSHCDCCLTYSIHLVVDESYDAYIYQSDKFQSQTIDWLDNQAKVNTLMLL